MSLNLKNQPQYYPNFTWKNEMQRAQKQHKIRIAILEQTGNVDCATRAKFKLKKLEKRLADLG